MSAQSFDPNAVIDDYFNYTTQYLAASSHLQEDRGIFWPRVQIRGHLTELALKTYLCAAGQELPTHDLEELAAFAEKHGLEIQKRHRDRVVAKLQKPYYEHTGWNQKFLCRYPMPNRGMAVWITPGHQQMVEFVDSVLGQARELLGNAS